MGINRILADPLATLVLVLSTVLHMFPSVNEPDFNAKNRDSTQVGLCLSAT